MALVTLALAVLGSLAAIFASPARALCVYCAGLFLYPQALTVQIGSADFSLARFLILAVLFNAVVRAKLHRPFHWSWMDTFVSLEYVLGFIALLQTFPAIAVERHAGAFFDTVLPYFAVRMIVTREDDLLALAKTLALIAVPLVVLGMYQSLTGVNPIGDLSEHFGVGLRGYRAEHPRMSLGLHRAAVTFRHPIAFGVFCAMVVPLTLTLWKQHGWPRSLVLGLAAIAGLGAFISLSGTSLLAMVGVALVFLTYWRWRVIAVAAAVITLVIGLAWITNVSLIGLFAGFAPNPRTAVYRVTLIQEALGGGMRGHWIAGYGYVGVGAGTDNTHFQWVHQDPVNIYIQILVRTGLLGLIPFVLANGLWYVRLMQAWAIAATPRAVWLVVCLLAAMLGINFAFMSVGALSQIRELLYVAIAMTANMPLIVAAESGRAR